MLDTIKPGNFINLFEVFSSHFLNVEAQLWILFYQDSLY